MADILLNSEGDIRLSEKGDISIGNSVVQAVRIKLKWILDEWRLGPDLGLAWFEEIWVKNPNTMKIKSLVRNEIMSVEGVTGVGYVDTVYNRRERTFTLKFNFTADEDAYYEEVTLNG